MKTHPIRIRIRCERCKTSLNVRGSSDRAGVQYDMLRLVEETGWKITGENSGICPRCASKQAIEAIRAGLEK